jgi:hypothetical protein
VATAALAIRARAAIHVNTERVAGSTFQPDAVVPAGRRSSTRGAKADAGGRACAVVGTVPAPFVAQTIAARALVLVGHAGGAGGT